MPTMILMHVAVSVPVPDKDAIAQMVVTQALTAAAEAIKVCAEERDGKCVIGASVKRVKEAPQQQPVDVLGGPHSPPGDTPETMPVSLP